MIAPSNTNFEISPLIHSISLANRVSNNVEWNDPFLVIQKAWNAKGFQGIGSNESYLTHGMGQVDGSQDTTTVASGGFDFGTALGTSGFWLMVGGGALLYYLMFGQQSAKERGRRLSAARQRYSREVSGIKGEYTRTRRRKGSSGGAMSKYKECDMGPSGKIWSKGAWRKPENVESC